ncbi:MAG: hypothetical protein HXN34_03230 [Prevotella histicola]|nr:hypothetical protein [Prevotella histicola]
MDHIHSFITSLVCELSLSCRVEREVIRPMELQCKPAQKSSFFLSWCSLQSTIVKVIPCGAPLIYLLPIVPQLFMIRSPEAL